MPAPRPRFANLDGRPLVPALGKVLRWQLGLHAERRQRAARTGVPVPFVGNDGAALRHPRHDSLTWIGHASFLLQLGGTNVLVDPVLSHRLGGALPRNVPPGLDWPALPRIDLVLITHDHRDHLDAPTVKRLGPGPTYVVPRGLGAFFRRARLPKVVELGWWETEERDGVRVTLVPAQHWSRRSLADTNASWWGGFVVERSGLRLYHAGDTAWFEGFSAIRERLGSLDVAMLPIGAYAPRWFMRGQHLDPSEAVRAFQALGAERFVAMHWGTFKLTDEPLDEPPRLLQAAWQAAGLPARRCAIPAVGETLRLDR